MSGPYLLRGQNLNSKINLVAIGAGKSFATLAKAAKTGDNTAKRHAVIAASRLGRGGDLAAFDALGKVPGLDKVVAGARERLVAAKECNNCKECFPLCPTSYLQAAFVLVEGLAFPREEAK